MDIICSSGVSGLPTTPILWGLSCSLPQPGSELGKISGAFIFVTQPGWEAGRVGGSHSGKECWGVFMCAMSQAMELRTLISAQLPPWGQFAPVSVGWRTTNCLWKVFLVIAYTKSAGALCNCAFILETKRL